MATKQPQIIVIGCTNCDINITPISRTELPGGGAYFSALAASLVTKPIGFVSKVGQDFDLSFIQQHLDLSGLQVITGGKTTRSVQTYHDLNDLTKRSIVLEEGVSFDLFGQEIPVNYMKNGRYFLVSTMPPLQQRAFIQEIRKANPQAIIAVDTDSWFFDKPGFDKEIAENLKLVDIVFLNRVEANHFSELLPSLPHLVVKQDKDGAFVQHFGNKTVEVPLPHSVPVKDATGAGDVLAGTYLAHLSQGATEEHALKAAVSQATYSVRELGITHLLNLSLTEGKI